MDIKHRHYVQVKNFNDGRDRLEDEPRPCEAVTQMFCIFFSVNGVVAQIIVPEGQTVTGKLHANQILPSVFQKYRGRTTVRDVMLHHDNAAPHRMSTLKVGGGGIDVEGDYFEGLT